MTKIISDVLCRAGGATALAEYLNVSRQTIYQWKRIPAARVSDISKLTGISREKLRPDIFK